MIEEFPDGPPDGMSYQEWAGSMSWAKWVRNNLGSAAKDTNIDSDRLLNWLGTAASGRIWTDLLTDKNGRPFPDFKSFCEASRPFGLGVPFDELESRLGDAAVQMRRLTESTAPPLAEHGTNQHSEQEFVPRTPKRQDDRLYKIQRLRREGHAEVADRVVDNEISAAEGMRIAGLEPKGKRVQLHENPDRAARHLVDVLGAEWCRDLMVALSAVVDRNATSQRAREEGE